MSLSQLKAEFTRDGGRGPCKGLIVVDMGSIVAAPMGSRVLADLGATVIKVETATSDLALRRNPPVHNGQSAYNEFINAGKKSVVIDPKTPEGVEQIKALCRIADVFLQNSRPGVMERLGLGYEDLKKVNPGLIYVSVSGFGEGNSFSENVAYDQSIQAITGFMPTQGGESGPSAIVSPVADKITAIFAANAAMAALLHRERSGGEGQKVVISMITAYAAFMLSEEMNNLAFRSLEHPHVPAPVQVYRTIKTADGAVLGFVLQPAQFQALCKVMGRMDLADDPAFATSAGLTFGATRLHALFAEDIAKLTTAEFLARMREAKIPFERVNSAREFIESDCAREAKVYVDLEDPELGTIRHINHPATYSATPADVSRPAPRLGQHSEEIKDLIGKIQAS